MASVSAIRPLPADVLSQIRSSVTIATLNDVVLNLVKNSLDSNASRIEVAVDYSRGSCSVEDDGVGIEPVEFSERGGLGKLHHTSKSFQYVENHGGRGSFIALLSALSLIAITSHHHQHRSHNTLTLHRSKVIARQIPAPAEHRISDKDHGTRVTVRDLFGNMPVRVRQRASEPAANDKEWQSLRKCIVGLLLAWPHGVSITLRNSISTQNMKIRSTPDPKELRQADVNHVCSILSQVMFITPSDKEFWVSTTASTSHLIISGTMSIEPCPHKSVQFISFHVHPIADSNGCNFLYDHINRLFATSSFGNEEEDESSNDAEARKGLADARFKQDGYTSRQLKSSKKGSNKWPMFCLKIESRDVASSLGEVDDFLDEKRGHMTSVMDLLEAMVVGFLKEHHFRVESRNRSGRRIGIRDSHTAKLPQVTNKSKMVSTRKYTPSYGKHARMNLGTDIKLPSFSRGSTDSLESSFGTWTRVKRGQMGTTQKTVDMSAVSSTDGVYLEPGGSSVPKPTFPSAPDQSSRETVAGRFFAPRNKNSVRHYGDHASKFYASGDIRAKSVEASAAKSTPLVGVDGKVSRLPFEFENHTPSEKNNATKPTGMDPPMPSDSVESPDDNFVSWIDPISKARSLICGRTGLVVTPQKLMTVQDSDSSLNTFRPHTLSSGTRPNLRTTGRAREEPSTWISGLLNSWDNPVFQPAELPIPQLSIDSPNIESQQIMHGRQHKCSHSDIDNAFRQSSGGPTGRLTKDALRNAEVISQVDKKFILIKISTTENQDFSDAGMSGPSLLVLVDQHAADERCRVEELFHELCTNTVPLAVQPPICFDVSDLELRQFRRNVDHFRNWGISYEIFDASKSTGPGHQVTVQGLPSVIIERCRIEPKVLVKLMRTDIWNAYHRGDDKQQTGRPLKMSISDEPTRKWFNKLRECPAGLLDMLNSRSCRSAIMFNDELSDEQCKSLISQLARCEFPFQCAHGRPSMIPLVDLSTIFQNP